MFKCLFFQFDRKKTILDKSHCKLPSIPCEILSHEKTLIELNLSSNKIKDIPLFLFQMKKLKVINLSDNRIEDLPHRICLLTNLENLDLSQNEIHELPMTLVECLHLSFLSLRSNPLHRISDDFFNFSNLTSLNLNDTSLTSINEAIKNLSTLENLEIRDNFLTFLPNSIGSLTNLQKLDIGSNEIETLNDSISGLENLNELWLDSNKLTVLPNGISKLKKLQILDLSKNDLRSLPIEIGELESLTDLNVANNRLSSLPSTIGQLFGLKMLKLHCNIMEELPVSIGNLVQLKEFFLHENLLQSLPNTIGNLKEMVSLNADCNLIKVFPLELCDCINLTILSLHSNKIKIIPEEISNLSKLHVLNLSKNLIEYLPYSMAKLMLWALWLVDNQHEPIVPLTSFVLPNNKKALTNYLLPQEIDSTTLNDNDNLQSEYLPQSTIGGECNPAYSVRYEDEENQESDDENSSTGLKRQVTPFPRDLRSRHPNIVKNNENQQNNGYQINADKKFVTEKINDHLSSSSSVSSSISDYNSENLNHQGETSAVFSNNMTSRDHINLNEINLSNKLILIQVKLTKQNESFGFDISGGFGTPPYNLNYPNRIYVSAVHNQQQKDLLKIGDRLVEVNDINIEELSHQDFIELMKSFKNVTLTIERNQAINFTSVANNQTDVNSDYNEFASLSANENSTLNEQIQEINIIKGDNILGFSIVGGTDEFYFPFNTDKPGIFVTKVVENSAAFMANLKPGYQILSVNSVDVNNLTHDEALALIVKNSENLRLTTKNTLPPDGLQHVVIERHPDVKLGISIKGGIFSTDNHYDPIIISKINDGAIKIDGRVKVGMCIIEVNGVSMIGAQHDHAVKILKALGNHLEFVICNSAMLMTDN